MHATRLLFEALAPSEREPLPALPARGICCLTGEEEDCLPRGELFGKSFVEQHLFAAPESDMVGVAAFCALKHKWERMGSWMCDRRFAKLTRQDVRPLVIGGVTADRWAGYITTSYKKHGSLHAPVNTGRRQIWQFEMLTVDCSDRARLADWWGVLNEALRQGIGRQSMEALEMPPGLMLKIGVVKWERFRAWAKDKHQTGLYKLLCYLLPSQEELKLELVAKNTPKEKLKDELFAL